MKYICKPIVSASSPLHPATKNFNVFALQTKKIKFYFIFSKFPKAFTPKKLLLLVCSQKSSVLHTVPFIISRPY